MLLSEAFCQSGGGVTGLWSQISTLTEMNFSRYHLSLWCLRGIGTGVLNLRISCQSPKKVAPLPKFVCSILLNPPPPSATGFPSLKVLHPQAVKNANPDSFSKFLSCCPVLQDLYRLHWKDYNFVSIRSTTNLRWTPHLSSTFSSQVI